MAQLGDETGVGQQPHRPKIGNFDHDGFGFVSVAEEGYDTVRACRCVLHDASIAIDDRGVIVHRTHRTTRV